VGSNTVLYCETVGWVTYISWRITYIRGYARVGQTAEPIWTKLGKETDVEVDPGVFYSKSPSR